MLLLTIGSQMARTQVSMIFLHYSNTFKNRLAHFVRIRRIGETL
jgi:hypothetical protein